MPKAPKFNHPFRIVRTVFKGGMSQEMFAKQLGVSASLVKRVELGQVHPSASLIRKVSHLTGVTPDSIRSRRDTPKTFAGREVSPESLDEWQRWRNSTGHEIISLLALKHAELSLRALAVTAAQSDRSEPLFVSFQEWLEKAIAEFGIETRFKKNMKALTRLWNLAMKNRGHLLLVTPEPSTSALFDATRVGKSITRQVQTGEAPSTKWSARALEEAMDEQLQASPVTSEQVQS